MVVPVTSTLTSHGTFIHLSGPWLQDILPFSPNMGVTSASLVDHPTEQPVPRNVRMFCPSGTSH